MVREASSVIAALLCALVGLLSCSPGDNGDSPTAASLSAKYDIILPPQGTGPIKVFTSVGTQAPVGRTVQSVWIEWPDGTEAISGRNYLRTRRIVFEEGRPQNPEFTYHRYDDDAVYAIDKSNLSFGEYYTGPRRRRVGQSWTTADATETKKCRISRDTSFALKGRAFSPCYEVRCSITTLMPDGVTFEGEDLSTECSGTGTVRLLATSTSGNIEVQVENNLVDFLENGAAP